MYITIQQFLVIVGNKFPTLIKPPNQTTEFNLYCWFKLTKEKEMKKPRRLNGHRSFLKINLTGIFFNISNLVLHKRTLILGVEISQEKLKIAFFKTEIVLYLF